MTNTRVIFSTGSLWLVDTAYAFELAGEAGFDGIEVMCDERFTSRNAEYLSGLSARYSLPIPVVHTPFTRNLPGWGKSDSELERVRRTLDLAQQMESETIVVHLPLEIGRGALSFGRRNLNFPWTSDFSDFKKWMMGGGLKQMQSETRVQIAIENMPAKYVFGRRVNPAWRNTVEEWSVIHEHLTLDTTHWATFGIDPLIALQAAGDRVKHIHLSNFNGREHRLPQDGQLDLGKFLQQVAAMRFSGTVSVEVQPDALNFDNPRVTQRKLRETLDFCRRFLT